MSSRLSTAIEGRGEPAAGRALVGLLPGEGVGPELTRAAERVLAVLGSAGVDLELRVGPSAETSIRDGGLTEAAVDYCRDVFAAGGAVLAGPHGGRWVYELRQRFDLFCKLSPVCEQLAVPAGDAFDQLVVREQAGGVYQGRWSESDVRREGHVAEHAFSYSRREVARIIAVGVELAASRSGRVAVIVKAGGLPSISRLWRTVAEEYAADRAGIELEILDVDFACYRLVRDPSSFDVIVTPNLFGDIISDLGGAVLGSRGMCFGASFDAGRAAVFQTNHGAAWDLEGTGTANPCAHLLSLAMMLRESFGLFDAAAAVEAAIAGAAGSGMGTPDIGGSATLDDCVSAVCDRVPGELVSTVGSSPTTS